MSAFRHVGKDFGCHSTFCNPPGVPAPGQLWQGDEGVGPGRDYSPSWSPEGDRQAGTSGLGSTGKGKPTAGSREPLGLASSGAFPASSKSWGAAAHKLWPLFSSSEGGGVGGRKKEVGSSGKAVRISKSKGLVFCCLPRDRARSQEAAFVVPVKEAMLTWSSWIGLISQKTSCQTEWEMEFSGEVCADSPPPTNLASSASQHTT